MRRTLRGFFVLAFVHFYCEPNAPTRIFPLQGMLLMTKNDEDFRASKIILRENLRLFAEGTRDVYRVIAVELRKLMCDRPQPLLMRIFREVNLHKLHLTGLLEQRPSLADGLDAYIPGRLPRDANGQAVFTLLFDKSMQQLPLNEWVQQPCFNPVITVQDVIKSIADKEGAHADPAYNDTLEKMRGWKLIEDESHKMVVCGIAKYLLDFLDREELQLIPA